MDRPAQYPALLIKMFAAWLLWFIPFSLQAKAELQLPLEAMKDYQMKMTPADLLGSNDAGVGVKKGHQIVPFEIRTHEGKPTSLPNLLKQAPLLVVFYRGGWCPYCNLQIRELTLAFPEFQKRKVTPVLISVDEVDGAALAQKTYEIPFPVLSDPDLQAHTAFDVILEIDDALYEKYKTYGIVLDAWSKRDHHKIAVSSAFLVDAAGVVQWAHVSKDYSTRPSAEQLLSVIDAWQKKDSVLKQ